MATVHHFLPSPQQFFSELQNGVDDCENNRHERFMACLLLQRRCRGHTVRKYVAWLHFNAIIIQCAFRKHVARKIRREMLREAVKRKHANFYNKMATRIQALWRGYYSRKHIFSYKAYKEWLKLVTERGERRAAEAEEFGIRSRADNLKILEEEARQWLAYVVFKLHHLLRTAACAGIYSDPMTTELSEFEKLLKSIHYTEYMNRLKRKYKEFVRRHRPSFSNKRMFPIIGDGSEYWYLSLAEMYELSNPVPPKTNTRFNVMHHGKMHTKPFVWKKFDTGCFSGRGPFQVPVKNKEQKRGLMKTPPPSLVAPAGDGLAVTAREDPRFYLYVQYYKPEPKLFDYVDFQINALLHRKCSIEKIEVPKNK